jgi:uncharacterized membrane protein YedE/YeeE
MTDPKRVIAFLEIGNHWSENLLFVMVGALSVTLATFPWILRLQHPVLDSTFHVQKKSSIDSSLLIGALIFGVGWGLSGYCPGPLIAGLASLKAIPWFLFLTFLVGQWLARRLVRDKRSSEEE